MKALLKRIPSAAYLYAVLGVALIGAYQYWAHEQQEKGALKLIIAQHERTNADLRRAQDSLAKAYRVDTVRLRVIRTQVDTLTRTVENWKTDTLEVVKYVAKADSAISVCSQALLTCEQRVGVAQKGWDNARAEIALLKKSIPSKLSRCGVNVGAGVVWDGTEVRAGPSVGVGCRVFP